MNPICLVSLLKKNLPKKLERIGKYHIFAPLFAKHLGLTGFDSKLRWYVSTRSDGCKLLNTFGQKINWQQ